MKFLTRLIHDPSFKLAFLLTVVFMGTGVIFKLTDLVDYGLMLFVLLPLALGISIALMPRSKYTMAGVCTGLFVILSLMLLPGIIGPLCILMCLPLISLLIFFGIFIGRAIQRFREKSKPTRFPILLLPLVPFLFGGPAENIIKKEKETIVEVKTERIFNYTTNEVYEAIKSVDTLYAEQPLLMMFDLPIPVKCVLEKEEVGGLRTCYFKEGRFSHNDFGSGTITERITELEPGKVLKMDVVDYTLVGRDWLGFREAIYYFNETETGHCKLIRITTYTSQLAPRIYWEPLETLGVRQEHDYVFNNLERQLKEKYGER